MGFREIVDFLIPAHFTEGEGGLKLLTFATMIDASVERMRLSLESRFPSRAGDSALELIGKDRLIIRGRTEAREHYAERLKRWRYPRGHRTRGTAYALLEQVCEYFGGALARVYTIRGRVYQRAADSTESWFQSSPFNWDGAAVTPNWGRFWISVTFGSIGAAVQSDSFNGSDPIGLAGVTRSDVLALRGLVSGRHPWKPAGVRAEWMIFADDFAAATPNYSWAHWSGMVGVTQVSTRYAGWRYVSLNPAINNRYSGNPGNFCTSTVTGGGMLSGYTGNSSSFPVASTRGYAGSPTNFPTSVLLLDDGDVI